MKQILAIVGSSLILAGCGFFDFEYRDERTKSWYERDRERYLETKSEKPSVYLRDISSVFNDYNLVMPNGNRIRVCSAYSCTYKQVYRLQPETLKRAKRKLDGNWTARGERDGLEDALQIIEEVMGPATGTSSDRQGGPWWGNGNTAQMNATDEALNVTSILMVMYRYNMVRYHDLLAPAWKSGAFYPRIRDRASGEVFGIDAGYREHGGEIKIFPWRGDAP